jgi:hypothetical protein
MIDRLQLVDKKILWEIDYQHIATCQLNDRWDREELFDSLQLVDTNDWWDRDDL